MNYANMIEERKLKQGFIIATLISTVVGTFTTGIGLFDRINDKRKQHKRDHSQDDKIKELEKRVSQAEERSQSRSRRDDSDGRGGGARRGKGRGYGGYDRDDIEGDRLRDSLAYGGEMVRREYDAGFGRLGERFGNGDLLAQTQLQSQIITLQSTVISLLEQALITGQPPDLTRLRNASEFARAGSIRALRDQYQRLLQSAPLKRPIGIVRRVSSTPEVRDSMSRSSVGRPPGKALTFNTPGPLFCSYAEALQRGAREVDGDAACPACGSVMPRTKDGRPWVVMKEVVRERVKREEGVVEYVEERRFEVTDRFVVKCHREGAGFACWLCYRFREGDALCKGAVGLVRHLGEEHTVAEMEREGDLRACC